MFGQFSILDEAIAEMHEAASAIKIFPTGLPGILPQHPSTHIYLDLIHFIGQDYNRILSGCHM